MDAARIRRSLSAVLFSGKTPRFHLDTPHVTPGEPHYAASPLHVSGWVAPPAGGAVRSVDILIDGELVARTSGRGYLPRAARGLPGRARRLRSAFSTE